MHIRNVEPVAITPPNFIEDLRPLLSRNPIDKKSSGRNRLLCFVSLWRRIVKVVRRALGHQHFRTIFRKRVAADVFGNRRLLTILEGKNLKGGRAISRASVIKGGSNCIKQMSGFGRQPAVVVSADGNARSAADDAVKVFGYSGWRYWTRGRRGAGGSRRGRSFLTSGFRLL